MTTLYEAKKDAFDAIAARGGKPIADMAKHFYSEPLMSEALGFQRGAVRHWTSGSNFSATAVRRAIEWLDARSTGPAPEKPAETKANGVMLLVVCDQETAGKIKRLAALFGAEVEDI